MFALGQQEESRGLKPFLREDGKRDVFRQSSSIGLPNIDVLQGLLFARNLRKPNLDPNSLSAFGSIRFTRLKIPYFEHAVSAGYPSYVDDPFKRHLDLSSYLIRHPKSVYYFKVIGYSMTDAGINDKDLLVVDTALQPKHKDIVIAVLNGEFTLKRLLWEGCQVTLLSANPDFPAIVVTSEMKMFIHGVVTTVIRTFNPIPYDNHFKDRSYSHF